MPDKPTEKSYKDIVALVKTHFSPKPSVIVQLYRFNSRVRQPGETVATYVADLRRMTKHCEFGATLDDMLRDRIVCGINDGRMQRRLLAEAELTLKKALDMVLAMESADKNVQDLQGPKPVHAIRKPKDEFVPRKPSSPCYRCGGEHPAHDCRFKEVLCHHCKKKGHLAHVCRSKTKTANPKGGHQPTKQHKPGGRMHTVTDVDDPLSATEDPEYTLFRLASKADKPPCWWT